MQASAKATQAAKENHNSVSTANTGAAQNLIATNTAVRMNAESVNRDRAILNEAGADAADEEGLGEEQVMVVEGAEEAGEGLFGGAIASAAAAGPGGLAAAGLAAVGMVGSNDTPGVSDLPLGASTGPIQIANAESVGINVGPSDDGSVLVSGGKTDVGILGSQTPVASVGKLSLLNPEAPLPSGNPVSVDPETQVLGLSLGPVAQTGIDLNLETLPDAAVGLVGDLTSGKIAVDQLLALDVPTAIAGTDLPVTSSLNDALVQVDSALSPVTDALQSAIGGTAPGTGGVNALTDGLDTLNTLPLIGDLTSQLDGLATGGLPTGDLPFQIPTDSFAIPSTGSPLDVGTSLINSSISSLPSGDLPLASLATGLVA